MSDDPGTTRFPSGAVLITGEVEADDDDDAGGASGGLHRGAAVGAGGVWTGISELPAGKTSTPHHHGDQTTIVYLVTGSMEFVIYGEHAHRFTAQAGDLAIVPAGVVHAEMNPSAEGCLSVVVRTNGEEPTVVNLGPDEAGAAPT